MKKEMIGGKYGKLTVISEAGKRSNGETQYLCRCDCGEEKVVAGSNLRNGHTTSCGCMRGKNGIVAPSAVKKAFKAAAQKKAEKTVPRAAAATEMLGARRLAEMVPIGTIEVNRNIRRGEITPENDPKILELANSIKQIGILEPLIVNDTHSEDGRYQLIAGHRRLAAATIAEREQVPAIVYDNLDGRGILEIQISENLHRVDLRPTEIADVYVRMRDELGMAVDEIAQRVGRSSAHVYQYIQLLTLPEVLLEKIDADEIGIAKALVLCTLPDVIIDKLVTNDAYSNVLYNTTAREFPGEIKKWFMKDLSSNGNFDTNKKYTDKNGTTWPACTDCPHKKQTSLFADVFETTLCPDKDCYWEKDQIAYYNKQAEQQQAKSEGGEIQHFSETEEERQKRGEKMRKYEEKCRIDREKREKEAAEENEKRKPEAQKQKEKTEYYLDWKLSGKINAADCYFYVHDACDMECYNPVDNEMLGELYLKYTGKTLAEIKESGTAEDVIKAMLIYYIYDNTENIYSSRSVANWIGCEIHPDDKSDDEDDDEDSDSEDDE